MGLFVDVKKSNDYIPSVKPVEPIVTSVGSNLMLGGITAAANLVSTKVYRVDIEDAFRVGVINAAADLKYSRRLSRSFEDGLKIQQLLPEIEFKIPQHSNPKTVSNLEMRFTCMASLQQVFSK